jgi:hypothetical protein
MKSRRPRWPFLIAIALLLMACGGLGAPAQLIDPGTGLAITAVAGPTCPVESIPPDPACAPRPVAGATINILAGPGTTVATVVTDATGTARVALRPGDYVVAAQPTGGMMGTPEPQDVTVVDGTMTPVALAYDTGIR